MQRLYVPLSASQINEVMTNPDLMLVALFIKFADPSNTMSSCLVRNSANTVCDATPQRLRDRQGFPQG
jgi:hypothetical protein